MTSFRQSEANRRNAQRSTGPTTKDGKRQSRRNALRHGLCAETVIEIVEDVDDYKGFEAAIIADYDAHTAVERELVLRLASLLWRIRRATSIETDLMRVQAEILHDRRAARRTARQPSMSPQQRPTLLYRVIEAAIPPGTPDDTQDDWNSDASPQTDSNDRGARPAACLVSQARDLTYCFQRLTNLDNGAFDRLGRYQAGLWRQVVQTLFFLQPTRRR
jgi:hypothetical protein